MKNPRNFKLYMVLGLLLLMGAAVFLYPKKSPAPLAASALFETMAPEVDNSVGYYTVRAQDTPQGGVIVFPDDCEDPVSYAPLARKLSALGFEVRVAKYPLGRTSFKTDYANILPEDKGMGWVSIGIGKGADKACFLGDQHSDVKGLILIGACSTEVNLNDNDLQITLYQIESNPVSDDRMAQIRKKLPADAKFKVIASKAQVLDHLVTSDEDSPVGNSRRNDVLSEEIHQILIAQPVNSENSN